MQGVTRQVVTRLNSAIEFHLSLKPEYNSEVLLRLVFPSSCPIFTAEQRQRKMR